MKFLPDYPDTIPSQAIVSLEFSAPSQSQLDELETTLVKRGRIDTEKYNLGFGAELLCKRLPVELDLPIQELIAKAGQFLNLSHRKIPLISCSLVFLADQFSGINECGI